MATVLWLAVNIFSANAEECFTCAKPGDVTTLRGRVMSVGEAVNVLNGLCGLSVTIESFVKANKNSLGDYNDSSQWIELHVGQEITIPSDAIKAPEKINEVNEAEVVVAPKADNDVGKLDCENISGALVPESLPFNRADFTVCHFTVKNGDATLAKLAARFHQSIGRLEFFNPHIGPNVKLPVGSVVNIPNGYYTYYLKPGAAPVGEKELEFLKAKFWPKLRFFQDYPELIPLMAEKYKKVRESKHGTSIQLQSGMQMKQWLSGAIDRRGHPIKDSVVVYNNGVCAYSPSVKVWGNVFAFRVPKTDRIEYIVMPFNCYNWVDLLDEGTYTPPPVTITPPPTPPVIERTPCPPCPPPLKVDNSWHSLYMVDLWAGASFPPDDKSSNYNGGGLWYQMWQKGLSAQRYGFALKVAGWHGNDHCNTSWDGGEFSVGPLAMLSFNQKHIFWGIEPAGMGGKYSWSRTVPTRYNHVYETNPYFLTMQTLNVFGGMGQLAIWCEGDLAWMKKTSKESWRNGSQLYQSGTTNPDSLDAVDNNSKLSFEVKYLIGPNEWTAQPLIFASTNYTFDNRIPKTNDVGVGVAFGHGAYQLKAAYENGFSRYHSSDRTYIISIDGNIGWFPWIYND